MKNALAQLSDLVDRFDRNIEAYRNSAYKEAQLRAEFIDPFFEALGWDVTNKAGNAEQYKDVILEDAIKVAGATKAPDYCFRIGGARKFFLETKKPSIDIRGQIDPAYQLRRYAWSAKLPLSILTDFEEMAVYDCRLRPKPTDKPSVGRVKLYTYKQYFDSFDEIHNLFSKEAILKGAFDKFAVSDRQKRGTTEVDAEFLKEIESWRDALAKNIALRNPKLSVHELNFAVQLTIDRIIFLRMCEDRGIESYGQIQSLFNGVNIYHRLLQIFYRADEKYNSGLFDFKAERLTSDLFIDDRPLKDIFKNLYYPESPYEFSVLGADILGSVYEQFLGKVIRLTEGHRARVEEKPEVRKAGGVYYTPTYIVDYIVKNTVGKIVGPVFSDGSVGAAPRGCPLETTHHSHPVGADRRVRPAGLTPQQISKIRILDPACGSGSFLLGAYQYLLDYHIAWYQKEGYQKHSNQIYQGHGGQWFLTTQEKKRILLNNIYGVDIDPQAVEVTKLSLLLKVLEGENQDTLERQMKLFRERALPDLGNNIKCGNSLIGPDFQRGKQMDLLNSEEMYRVNPFDWEKEFHNIMKEGGFDAVIGNPPYIRIQTMKEWAPIEVELYKQQYASASKGNYDIYVVFVERGLNLLNKRGRLGFILPHKFFNAQYGQPLRGVLAEGKHLAEVVHFGDQQIFAGATNYTCLLFLDKGGCRECHFSKVVDLIAWRNTGKADDGTIPYSRITPSEWNFAVGRGAALLDKLGKMPVKLGDVAHLFVGLQTDADDVFILEEVRREAKRVLCKSKSTGHQHWFEDEHLKPFLKGSLNIRRYSLADLTKRLIFPYEIINDRSLLIDTREYKRHYPLTWAYLEENRDRLSSRKRSQMGHDWYGYVYKKNHTKFASPKLLVPSIATGSCFAADMEGIFYFVGSGGGGGGGYGIILSSEEGLSYLYLLGLLNSSLLSVYLQTISTPFRGGYIALNRQYIEQLPIRTIDFSDSDDKTCHGRMVKLVELMLSLHKQVAGAKTPDEKARFQRQIDATDHEIDQLVYDLYGLTEDEIKIVEERT
jgi:type I restriction-modification system DNA methylase subunit